MLVLARSRSQALALLALVGVSKVLTAARGIFGIRDHLFCCSISDNARVICLLTVMGLVKENGVAFNTTPISLSINSGVM